MVGATILSKFFGSDELGVCHTQFPNSSNIEVGVPTAEVKLCWDTLTEAAQQAGLSRLYGGIHFTNGNIQGQSLGINVANSVWQKTQFYLQRNKSTPEPNSLLGLTLLGIGVLSQKKGRR
jgi:hypothetical protein